MISCDGKRDYHFWGTYPKLTFILNACGERVHHVEAELVLSNVEILKSVVASEVCENGAESVLVSDDIVLESERLKFWQVCHLLSQAHDFVVGQHLVSHSDLVAT